MFSVLLTHYIVYMVNDHAREREYHNRIVVSWMRRGLGGVARIISKQLLSVYVVKLRQKTRGC